MKKLLIILLCLPMIGLASFPVDNSLLIDTTDLNAGLYLDLKGNLYEKSDLGNWRVKYNEFTKNNEWGSDMKYIYKNNDWIELTFKQFPKEGTLERTSTEELNKLQGYYTGGAFGVWSLILGLSGFGIPFVAHITAVILGKIGMRKEKKRRKFAKAGYILGLIGVAFWISWLFWANM